MTDMNIHSSNMSQLPSNSPVTTPQAPDKTNSLGVSKHPPQTETTAKTTQTGQKNIKPLTQAQKNMQAHRAKMQQGGGGRLHEVLGRSALPVTPQKTSPVTPQKTGEAKPLTKAQQNMAAHRAKMQETGGSGRLHETLGGAKPPVAKSLTKAEHKVQETFIQVIAEKPEPEVEPEVKQPEGPVIKGLSSELISDNKEQFEAALAHIDGKPGHGAAVELHNGQHVIVYAKVNGEGVASFKAVNWSGKTKEIGAEHFVAHGTFGTVQKATKLSTEGLKAIKTPSNSPDKAERAQAEVRNEFKVLSFLNRNGPVKGIQKTPTQVRFQNADGSFTDGTLARFYKKGDATGLYKQEGGPEPTVVAEGMADVLDGMDYMHGQKIYQGDVKDENILIDENNNFYMADFGGVAENLETAPDWRGGTPRFISFTDYSDGGKLMTEFASVKKQQAAEGDTAEVLNKREEVLNKANAYSAAKDKFAAGLTLYSLAVGVPHSSPFDRGVKNDNFCRMPPSENKAMFPKSGPAMNIQKSAGNEVYEHLKAKLGGKRQGPVVITDQDLQDIAEKFGPEKAQAVKDVFPPAKLYTDAGEAGFAKIEEKYGAEVSQMIKSLMDPDRTKRPPLGECAQILRQFAQPKA